MKSTISEKSTIAIIALSTFTSDQLFESSEHTKKRSLIFSHVTSYLLRTHYIPRYHTPWGPCTRLSRKRRDHSDKLPVKSNTTEVPVL